MKKRTSFEEVQSILGETFTLTLLSSAIFFLQNLSQISFNLFSSGDKRLSSELLSK